MRQKSAGEWSGMDQIVTDDKLLKLHHEAILCECWDVPV